jgi:hypothetical protein
MAGLQHLIRCECIKLMSRGRDPNKWLMDVANASEDAVRQLQSSDVLHGQGHSMDARRLVTLQVQAQSVLVQHLLLPLLVWMHHRRSSLTTGV